MKNLEKSQPKQVPQAQPKPQPQKQDAAAFDTLLKNLEKNPVAPDPTAKPQRAQVAAAALLISSQPRGAAQQPWLTASELNLVREAGRALLEHQCQRARHAEDLVVEVRRRGTATTEQ